MKHENFFRLLGNQIENLAELLTTVNNQQESLINNNIKNMDEAVKKEEYLFNHINVLQKAITNEIILMNDEENLGLKDFKLSSLIKIYTKNSRELKIISSYQKQIVRLIKEINRINFQNGFLIDHSRELIRSIITTVANKKAIFDRRA